MDAEAMHVEVERQFLAAVLDLLGSDAHADAVRDLLNRVPSSTMQDDACKALAAAIHDAANQAAVPTITDVLASLRKHPHQQARALLIELAKSGIGTGTQALRHATDAADELADIHRRRQAADAITDAAAAIKRGESSVDVLAELAAMRQEAKASEKASKVLTLADCCDAWAEHEQAPVVATGLRPFDRATDGGLPRGGLTGFVAPPGGCKSAMALQVVLGAVNADKTLRTLYCLGEMSPAELAERYACCGSAVYDLPPVTMLHARRREANARHALAAVLDDVGDRLAVLMPPLTVPAIIDAARHHKAGLVVIDFLQLVRGEGSNQVEILDGVVDELQRYAVESNAAVVVLSSMAKSNGTQARGAHDWARGSGSIGYSLSLLFVGERDEEPDRHGCFGFRWQCKKARRTGQQDVELLWDPHCQFFADTIVPCEDFADYAAEGALA